ncbi:MAG: IS1634 family transposase, partial [Leptospiraceae bacterium]|nr:IS1634 family transposase [Leptospiraceae bacterium]
MQNINQNIQIEVIEHLGIISSICQNLKLTERVDARLNQNHPSQIVTPGQIVSALILNGLGFSNHRVYLVSEFFRNKPVEKLIGSGIKAEHLNDDAIGDCLDDIYEYGATKLFSEIALEIVMEKQLLGKVSHGDGTSFKVEGEYNGSGEGVKITYGYSKDHRPDLKQIMLSLVMTSRGNIPYWVEAHDGNSSEKKTFTEMIKEIEQYKNQFKSVDEMTYVFDSALYSASNLLSIKNVNWISRVPETINSARELLELSDNLISWSKEQEGYKICEYGSKYAGINQRWVLVYSQEAYEKEEATLFKKVQKDLEVAEKCVSKLEKRNYESVSEVENILKDKNQVLKYHNIKIGSSELKGKNKYNVCLKIEENNLSIQRELNKKGRFIVASNVLNDFSDWDLLYEYKEQQKPEMGFRFLKDPWYLNKRIFLKKDTRIVALSMIMATLLLVYNYGQHFMRERLKQNNETLPNQVKKEIKNPTLRWICQAMSDTILVKQDLGNGNVAFSNTLNPFKIRIIKIFGEFALKIYGISEIIDTD